ncbi:MAG TPA: hypothetical protein VGM88_22675 [Kofleriaceae bacterium]|jgi:hypothetical protein
MRAVAFVSTTLLLLAAAQATGCIGEACSAVEYLPGIYLDTQLGTGQQLVGNHVRACRNNSCHEVLIDDSGERATTPNTPEFRIEAFASLYVVLPVEGNVGDIFTLTVFNAQSEISISRQWRYNGSHRAHVYGDNCSDTEPVADLTEL